MSPRLPSRYPEPPRTRSVGAAWPDAFASFKCGSSPPNLKHKFVMLSGKDSRNGFKTRRRL